MTYNEQWLTSEIGSRIEYLMPTDNAVVVLLTIPKLTKDLISLAGFSAM